MSEFLMKPKIDYAFKEIMMNEKARIGFLAAVLKLNPEEIKEAKILNPYLRKVHERDKLGILDVRVLLNNNTEIDTEIQLSYMSAWVNRSLFYLSKMYVDQLEEGEGYDKLKKCVSISVLDFVLWKEETDFYSCFHIWEDTRHRKYTDKMEFHVIELPKLPEELKTENQDDILLWAKFINAEREEEFHMIAAKNTYIQSAYQQLQLISQDEIKRQEYEAREKAIRDHNQIMKEARQEGIELGKQEGIKLGKQEGIELTKRELSQDFARKLLTMGQSVEFVVQATGLSMEQVEKLKKE